MFPFPLFILLSNFFVFRTGIIHAFLNVFTEPTVLLFHIRMEEFVGDCSTLTDALQNGRHCFTFILLAVIIQTLHGKRIKLVLTLRA